MVDEDEVDKALLQGVFGRIQVSASEKPFKHDMLTFVEFVLGYCRLHQP